MSRGGVSIASSTAPVSGVTSLNGETGAVTLVAGTNVTVTPSGSNITIASSGGASGIASINGDTTSAQLIAGSGGIDVVSAGGTTVVSGPIIKSGTVVVPGSGGGGSNPQTILFGTAFPGGYSFQATAEHDSIEYNCTIKPAGKNIAACDINIFPYPPLDITVDWVAIQNHNP